MVNYQTLNKVIKFTQSLTNGSDFTEEEFQQILKLLRNSDRNLNVYIGILTIFYFNKFRKIPLKEFNNLDEDIKFQKCLQLLNRSFASSPKVGKLLFNILSIPEENAIYRDVMLGSFYGSLWSFMNDKNNFNMSVNFGIELIKSAFSLDGLDIQKKLKIKRNGEKIVCLAGSGKKEIKLLNISSMSAVITAAVGKKINENIIVEKITSGATSSTTGSSDIFELIGVNFDQPMNRIAAMSLETRLGVFNINRIVPKLNHIYDGRSYDIQVFAGLVGGASIISPVDVDLINYGLSRGSTKLCLSILNKLYPDKNIIIIQGKDSTGRSVIDQVSVAANTEVARIINGEYVKDNITPRNFGFDFESFDHILSTKSSKTNLEQFIKLLAGCGNQVLAKVVAMEVSLNLLGLNLVKDLKSGADLALDVIASKAGIKVLENLVIQSSGDINKFKKLIKDII